MSAQHNMMVGPQCKKKNVAGAADGPKGGSLEEHICGESNM